MSMEINPASRAMAVEAHADLNGRLREFAEFAGLMCANCVLSYAVVSRARGTGRARHCQGPVSPIRSDVLPPAAFAALEAARQAEASFSYSGDRCQVYQSPGDGHIEYPEA